MTPQQPTAVTMLWVLIVFPVGLSAASGLNVEMEGPRIMSPRSNSVHKEGAEVMMLSRVTDPDASWLRFVLRGRGVALEPMLLSHKLQVC